MDAAVNSYPSSGSRCVRYMHSGGTARWRCLHGALSGDMKSYITIHAFLWMHSRTSHVARQDLTPPIVRPLTMCRCMMRVSNITGRVMMVAYAIMGPHSRLAS